MLAPLSGPPASPSVDVGGPFCEICAGYFALFRGVGVGGGGIDEPCLTVGVMKTNYNPA